MAATHVQPSWRDRLKVPNYRVGEAAQYAGVASQTVSAWQSGGERRGAPLREREPRGQLSYLDLIEVAVVGKFRKAGISLQQVRFVRDYVSKEFKSEFPFATYRFKTDGKELVMDVSSDANAKVGGASLWPARKGQMSWNSVMDPLLTDFDYEDELALRWHVDGRDSPILIDPAISFGAPTVEGVPTWALRDRFKEREPVTDTASDFGLTVEQVEVALRFERVLLGQVVTLN